MTLAIVVGVVGVGLAFLISDFAERLRHRFYASRNQEVPESQFQRYVGSALAVVFVTWSFVAYL
jgi:hypothetical protein